MADIDVKMIPNPAVVSAVFAVKERRLVYIFVGFIDGMFQYVDCLLMHGSGRGPRECYTYFEYYFDHIVLKKPNAPVTYAEFILSDSREIEKWYSDKRIDAARKQMLLSGLVNVVMHEMGHHIVGFADPSQDAVGPVAGLRVRHFARGHRGMANRRIRRNCATHPVPAYATERLPDDDGAMRENEPRPIRYEPKNPLRNYVGYNSMPTSFLPSDTSSEQCSSVHQTGSTSEGYAAYARGRAGQVIHAQCWSHSRRFFERAKDIEPEAAAGALARIGTMYRHEKQIREHALTGSAKHRYRNTHIRSVLEAFWKWCQDSCERPELLPNSPLAKALHYVRERRDGLEVFLNP